MCNQISSCRKTMSPLTVNIVKVAVVLIFFCFAECAAGSCLNYGHACWGAHGKRSGNHVPQNPLRGDDVSGKDFKTKWFLSRLIQSPPDLHYSRERDMEISARQNQDSPFIGNEVDNFSGQDWENIQDMIDDQSFDDTIGRHILDNSRVKSSTFVDKRSVKHN